MSNKNDKGEEVYCICQSTDSGSFMICCDSCETWYHTHCLGITRSFAKKVKTFYCFVCQNKNPKLEIEFKDNSKRKREKELSKNYDSIDKKTSNDEDSDFDLPVKKAKYQISDDDDDEFKPTNTTSYEKKEKKIKKQTTGVPGKRGRKRKEDKDKLKNKDKIKEKISQEDRNKVKNWRGAGRKPKDYYLKEKNLNKELNKSNKIEKRKYERKEKNKKDDKDNEKEEQIKQCLGPDCINAANKNTKYCSDECGLKLARDRLIKILPYKIEQWKKIPSKLDETNQKQLEQIRQEFIETRCAIEELDSKKQELEEIIRISKTIEPMTEEECNEQEDDLDGELSLYCVTCGHEVSYKNAARHMERCFNKFESQTSFSSIFKTKTEGVFCDYYNSLQKSYCKRLKVLCPEHSKDPSKTNEDEVCGAPLVNQMLEQTGEYCRWLKKKCLKHYCWEKYRHAQIDMEKVNNWLKLDDLFEKEQKIRFSMASRGDTNKRILAGIKKMPKVYENAKDYYKDSKGIACERIREELKQCLLESDCIRKEGRTAKECLTLKPASLSNECVKLNTLIYECKRSMLDPRHRFRGRRDLD